MGAKTNNYRRVDEVQQKAMNTGTMRAQKRSQ